MPFKASNSPYYKVEIILPGYGQTPRLSTKTERKSLAKKMEDALRYVWEDGHYDLIEALEPKGKGESGLIDLPTLYHAWRRGELRDLQRRLIDPPLPDAVRSYAKTLDYDNHRRGARHLIRLTTHPGGPLLAGQSARLSWLYDAQHITRCLRHMVQQDSYAKNTVRNELYGFVSVFLRERLGEGDAQQILADVDKPSVDDRRDVWLSADDVRRVVSASEWEMRMLLLLSASTGIDKSPLLRIRVRDVDFDKWSLFVRDTKTKSRKRTLQLAPVAVFCLQLLAEGRKASETVWDLSRGQINYRWRKARKIAGLTEDGGFSSAVRLKDLRHTFAVHYMRSGGSLAGLQGRLGHSRGAQSMMYARHELDSTTDMEQAAQSMGLELPDLLRNEVPEPEEQQTDKQHVPAWWFDRSAPPRAGGEELPVPKRMSDTKKSGGGRKGYTADDYRAAIQKARTMAGAARLLDVHDSTVREQCIRHEIPVPSIGGVPSK